MSNQINLCKVNQYIEIKKLKFHPKNPRTIEPARLEQLKDSIIKKGFYQPILVWKKGGVVLAGNHRLMAAKQLEQEGWEFVSPDGKTGVLPVVVEDVDAEIAEAILFETNNTYAHWIEEKLAQAIQEAEAAGRPIKGYGFDDAEVDRLLKAAIEEAEETIEVMAHDRKKGDGLPDVPEELAEVEEFESLILPKKQYRQLRELLAEISKTLAPEWHDGDSLAEAVVALVQAADEVKIIEHIQEQLSE